MLREELDAWGAPTTREAIYDYEAESLVLAALLDGTVTLQDLAPLGSKHFLTPWIRDAVGVFECRE
jgi:hypothetical protein